MIRDKVKNCRNRDSPGKLRSDEGSFPLGLIVLLTPPLSRLDLGIQARRLDPIICGGTWQLADFTFVFFVTNTEMKVIMSFDHR